MKREVAKEIYSCFACPLLVEHGIHADHWYNCHNFGDSPTSDGWKPQENKLDAILKGWFENCPTWRYLGE